MKKILKGVVVTVIDVLLFPLRIIVWPLNDWLHKVADWESRWYRHEQT